MKKRPPDAAQALPRPAELDIAALLRWASPVLLVVGVWLAYRPYLGLVDDSRIYMAQALKALHPEIFGADLFFVFGSQDDFSLYSLMFAPLVEWFGMHPASALVVAAGHALWLSGAAALALRFAPDARGAVVGLVLVTVMPAVYGAWLTFYYGEGFATPRLLAEGFSLWALWAIVGRRYAGAVAMTLLAALLHPLVAAAGLCVGWVFLTLGDWRWGVLAIVGVIATAALAVAGIAPFDRILQTMDSEWLAIVEQSNLYLFPSFWRAVDWYRLVIVLATAVSAALIVSGWRRQLLIAAILAGLSGVAAMYVGADLLHNLLVIQVQPYRTLWLLFFLSYLGAGVLIVGLWQLKPDGVVLIAMIIVSWLIGIALSPLLGMPASIVTLAIAVARLRGVVGPLPSLIRKTCIVLACVVLGFFVLYRVNSLVDRVSIHPGADRLWGLLGNLSIVDAAIAAAMLAFVVSVRPGWVRTVLPVAALVLFIVAASGWDRRGDWIRAVTEEYPIAPFDKLLPPDAQVFWEDDVRGAWFLLRRPSYVSVTQGAGIIFERRTALTFRDRAEIVQPVTRRELIDRFRARFEPPRPVPEIDRDKLVVTCRRDIELDALVLSQAVDGAYAARWSLPEPIYDVVDILKGEDQQPLQHFYLYRCTDIR